MDTSKEYVKKLDDEDPLSKYRDEFYIPEDTVYLNGNSLGLLSERAEDSIEKIKEEWKELAIEGWTEGETPWFFMAETLGEMISDMVGAKPKEVVGTGTTTVNIHALVSTFFEPKDGKDKIMADELNFPTDIYALKGLLELKDLDPKKKLKLVPSSDGHLLDEDKIVEMMTDDVALVHLPSVLYRSGQLLDMEYLTEKAHEREIIIGFDCSHSVGVIPHELHEWGVDYAMWCGYKYLNGGPGSTAFLYLNERHFDKEPKLKGWFGYEKEKQFDLALDFVHEKSAGGWQISSPSILGGAPLLGSLKIIKEAGLKEIREKSKDINDYFMGLVEEVLDERSYDVGIISPEKAEERSSHIAIQHEKAEAISSLLREKGFITDFRPPNVIRLAFSPLYNSYYEAWLTVMTIKEIIDNKEHQRYEKQEELVT
ncbi:MAG: kynureninase [Candidatus Thermoplasmatota archaeon]|nr:kynureninase [Candidatus Thermoplasmatota archaeon]MBS3790394.1 kynureninase [Candidatus Thermoplasmatota archaeon]